MVRRHHGPHPVDEVEVQIEDAGLREGDREPLRPCTSRGEGDGFAVFGERVQQQRGELRRVVERFAPGRVRWDQTDLDDERAGGRSAHTGDDNVLRLTDDERGRECLGRPVRPRNRQTRAGTVRELDDREKQEEDDGSDDRREEGRRDPFLTGRIFGEIKVPTREAGKGGPRMQTRTSGQPCHDGERQSDDDDREFRDRNPDQRDREGGQGREQDRQPDRECEDLGGVEQEPPDRNQGEQRVPHSEEGDDRDGGTERAWRQDDREDRVKGQDGHGQPEEGELHGPLRGLRDPDHRAPLPAEPGLGSRTLAPRLPGDGPRRRETKVCATARQSGVDRIHSSFFRRIASRRLASTAPRTALARSSGSRGFANTRPLGPSSSRSGWTRVVTTGNPAAAASRATRGSAVRTHRYGNTAPSECRYTHRISSRERRPFTTTSSWVPIRVRSITGRGNRPSRSRRRTCVGGSGGSTWARRTTSATPRDSSGGPEKTMRRPTSGSATAIGKAAFPTLGVRKNGSKGWRMT